MADKTALHESLIDIFETNGANLVVVDESTLNDEERSVVDGENIIGRVRGPMFVPNGESRNKRWYPRELWDKVLNDEGVKTRLQEKTVIGTIGHDEVPFSDKDLREGKASHITTKLWIDESGMGMGEILILGTPLGHTLLKLLKAGSKLSVSSRAFGEFKRGEQHEGMPIVDPETYEFQCFDFVLDPGFLQARPSLVENLNSNQLKDMDNNNTISESIALAQSVNKQLKEENERLAKKYRAMKEKLDTYVSKANSIVEQYRTILGDVKAVREALDNTGAKNAGELASMFTKKANISSLKESIDFIVSRGVKPETLRGIAALVDGGKMNESTRSLANAHKVLALRESKQKETIEKARTLVEAYKKYGTLKEMNAVFKLMEQYNALGSIPDLTRVLKICNEQIKSLSRAKNNTVAEALARDYNIEIEDAVSLIQKVGITEAKSVCSKLKGKKCDDKKKKDKKAKGKGKNEDYPFGNGDNETDDEDLGNKNDIDTQDISDVKSSNPVKNEGVSNFVKNKYFINEDKIQEAEQEQKSIDENFDNDTPKASGGLAKFFI